MARKISYKQAVNEALDLEMARDPSVILMGEDIVGGAGAPGEDDAWGGVLGVTKGRRSLEAAQLLEREGVDVEVIDLRTLSPIDWDTVIESVEKTGRLVAVDEAHPRCSIAADVTAFVAEHAFGALKCAPQAVTAPHASTPFAPALEAIYLPTAESIAAAVRKAIGRKMAVA
ncbi:transketolase C-terminal domain-containing protein [Methylocella sp.]|uniref:transketolase C-terminal domain-containing protein n=1 Tax=Methylocella sp. TaxID=1978226 RepID=UPI00378448A2